MAYNLRNRARARTLEPNVAAVTEVGDLKNRLFPQHKALAIEYILKEIMSHLPVEDLVECRLVNKVWNDVATRVFAPKAPILKFWSFSTTERRQVGPPDKFMETMSQSRNVPPCRKIFVHGDILKFGSRRDKLLLPQFFEKVAPFVIYLEIETVCDPIFGRAKPKEGLKYPKLKSLKLVVDSHIEPRQLEANLATMISILEHAPTLDSVSIETLDTEEHCIFFRMAERIPWSQIRHLTLNREMHEEDFQRMLELTGTNLQLQALELNLPFYTTIITLGKNFYKFLERQRDTLESLSLGLQMVTLEPQFLLPQLPKVGTLHVNLTMMTRSDVVAVGASLRLMSHQFPALQSVSLSGLFWISFESLLRGLDSDSLSVGSVRTLKLYHQDPMHKYEFGNTQEESVARVGRSIREIAKLFPRVKNLAVPANYTVLKAIDSENVWKDVEELRLICGHHGTANTLLLADKYSPVSIQIMESDSVLFGIMEREAERNILQFLKQVKVLKLEHRGVNGTRCLTGIACKWVLLKLENLRCLDLLDHTPHEVSEPVIHEMQENFRVLVKKKKNV